MDIEALEQAVGETVTHLYLLEFAARLSREDVRKELRKAEQSLAEIARIVAGKKESHEG